MVERFLFDGVDGQRARLSIHLADEHAILIASVSADARLTIHYLAMMWTELTLYPPIVQLLIVSALHQNTIAS